MSLREEVGEKKETRKIKVAPDLADSSRGGWYLSLEKRQRYVRMIGMKKKELCLY